MRIAVTGASGFIGTELLSGLKKRKGIKVTAITRGGSARADSPFCTWKETDWSVKSLTEALEGADAVIHLAGVRGTGSDPAEYAVNTEMTRNLLEAMTAAGTKRIVFASTISVYDDENGIPWKEDSVLKGRTMYGESKISCERLIREYAAKGGFTYGIVRIAQVLGEGEKRRGMMNVFIDTAASGGTLRVMGRSEAKRQYIYVKDLAEILAMLAEGSGGPDAGKNIIVNAGMPDAYTNLEIAKMVNAVFGNTTPIEYDDSFPETIRSSHMDISRLEKLGYTPLDMEAAVKALKEDRD